MSSLIATNEQGFAMLGNLKNVRPEPKPNWKTEVEDNDKKLNWKTSCPNKNCHVAGDEDNNVLPQ